MPKQCRICSRDLPIIVHNRQVYCDKSLRNCWKVAKQSSQRVIQQNKKLRIIKEGKVCKRCNIRAHDPSMREYCKKCKDILSVNHYSTYKPKPVKTCENCTKPVKGKSILCEICKKARHLEQMRKHSAKVKPREPCRRCGGKIPDGITKQARYCSEACRVNKKGLVEPKPLQKNKGIDPKWLTRGNITDYKSSTIANGE